MKKVIWLVMVFYTFCLDSASLRAQAKNKWTPSDIVVRAKSAMWVKMEGVLQADFSVMALEIKFLSGDFMDDDWELKAPVRAVTPADGEFQVLMMPVRVTEKTDFEKGLSSIEDIKPGMFLELEGTYLKEGVFLPKEIENITERRKGKKQSESEMKIEAVGKIGHVDENKRIITIMGIPFHINENTEGKSPIK
jgi:hypothetical protein